MQAIDESFMDFKHYECHRKKKTSSLSFTMILNILLSISRSWKHAHGHILTFRLHWKDSKKERKDYL